MVQFSSKTIKIMISKFKFRKNWMSFLVRRSGSWPGKLKFRKIFWICFPEFTCKGSKVVLTYDCDAENKKNENHNTNIYDGTFHFEISDLRKSNFTFTRAYCWARQLTFFIPISQIELLWRFKESYVEKNAVKYALIGGFSIILFI